MRFVPATGYDRFGSYPSQRHCCGCPNHVFDPKPVERTTDEPVDVKRIKDSKDIDGKLMTDDTEKKRSENLQELPEPIVWIPGSVSDRNLEKHPVYWVPLNRKSTEGGRERPCPGYWVPLDSNTGPRDRKIEDENAKLPPFPIFWIPTKFEAGGNAKVENPPQESKQTEGRDASKVENAMKTNGGEAEKINEGINSRPAEQKKEAAVIREIPVKQLEEEGKSSQAQKIEERVSKVSDNHHVKKASSPRASKLPPVCLRVDPLPRKKTNGTSSSRSPSPPRKVEESKDKVAVKAKENANASASKVGIETNKNEPQSNMQGKEAEVMKKIEIGRDQAAVRIQALYRGYQVRKFQSLRKLREIMKIRGRIEELRQQMSSPKFVGELSGDSKTRGKFNETLMGLLLQLDTIQGLHPVVRDVRKSVARELITLQEKLDTLVGQVCANRLQEASRKAAESDKIAAVEKTEEPITTSEAREICGDILLKTSDDDQKIESDKATNGENVENKGSIKLGVFEVENKATKDGEDVEQDVLQIKNETTIDRDDLEETVPIKQESCLDATTKEVKYEDGKYEEKVETVIQYNNGTGEKVLMLLPTEVTGENLTAEERYASGFSNARLDDGKLIDSALLKEEDVDNEKLSSATLGQEHGIVDIENEKLLDSALPGEEDSVNEKLSSVTLEKEQAIVDSENEKPEDSAVPKKDVVNEKLSSVTLEQEQGVVDIENEKLLDLALPKDEYVVNKRLSSVALEQEQTIEDMENVNASEKSAIVGEDNSIITAPEGENDQEKIVEICTDPVSDRNESERDIIHALTEETEECHDNDEMELSVEVPSLMISNVIEENNLVRMEETMPSNENADGKELPATAETQCIGKPVQTVNSLEAPLSVQNEDDLVAKEEVLLPALEQPVEGKESTLRCGEILQETELGMADMEDKRSIDSKCLANNKVEDANFVNTNESEPKFLQCEGKEDHEKWMEENEKLREMVEKLMSAGKRQMSTIVQLNDKIKQLEGKLSQGKSKRKVRAGQLKMKSNVTATNKRNSTGRGT